MLYAHFSKFSNCLGFHHNICGFLLESNLFVNGIISINAKEKKKYHINR